MIAHPAVSLLSHTFVLSHTFSRTDLFVVVFCVVDDWMKQSFGSSNAPRKRRGPRDTEFSDSEVLTVLLVGEMCHCQRERAWLRQVRASYGFLFPALPEDSRFSRRAEGVGHLLRSLRQAILFWADADGERLRLLDSFPMPLCACYRIRQSSQPISGSTFGYNASKEEFYFGLHPGLLVTDSGFIEDIVLAPGNWADVHLLAAYLDECVEQGRDLSGQEWIGDKGFFSKPLARQAKERLGLHILARKRDYQAKKGEEPPFFQKLLDMVRKPIERYHQRPDRVLWNGASAGENRLWHLSANPSQDHRLQPGALLQQGAGHPAHEHRPLCGLKTSKTRCPLTPAQMQVLQASIDASDISDKVLAELLCLSPYTIHTHFREICHLTDTHSRGAAVIVALKRGWISLPPPTEQIASMDREPSGAA